jgi:hypothetical protein
MWRIGHLWPLEKRRPKLNANLNRLANIDYSFEVNASEPTGFEVNNVEDFDAVMA